MTVSTIEKPLDTLLSTGEIVVDSNNGFEPVKTWFYLLFNYDTNVFFFGQAKDSRKDKRHKDDVYQKLIGSWNLQGQNFKVFWIGICEEGHHLDKKVHKEFKKLPNCIDNKKEGSDECFIFKNFDVDQVLDTCINITREIFGDVQTESKMILNLYKHQQDFLIKINSEWEDWTDFLLFAKCRAGKTVMCYYHIKQKKYKVTLLCSYRNSPKQSWQQDLQKFADFVNIRFIDMRDKDWEVKLKFYLQDPNIQIVLWSTVQGMKTTNNRLEKLSNITPIDFLVFDESHIGKNAEFKKIRNSFAKVRCLSISGTADKQIWEYPENRRFVYSFYEEQLDNMRGFFNPLRPKFKLTTTSYVPSKLYREIYGDDPDALSNIFSLNDEKTAFRHPELVREFIHQYFGPQRHIKNFEDRLLHDSQHILISLPSIGACHFFAEMIEQYYLPLVVTSDTKRTSDDIESFLQKNKEAKTITITCEANVLGTTQKLWDTVIHCKPGKSKEFWTQLTFRGGSGDKDWHVIDLEPQRGLECINEYYITSSERNPEIRQKMNVDFVAINQWQDGFEILSQEKIYHILSTDVTSATRLITGIFQKIDEEKLKELDINLNIKSGKKTSDKKVVSEHDGNGKSNEVTLPSETKKEKDSTLSELNQKRKALNAIGDSIPLVLFWELKDGNDINSIDSVINSPYYVRITEDSNGSLEQAFDLNLITRDDFLNRLMYATSWIQTQMNEDETMTLEQLSTTKNENRNIPVEFLDDMFMPELFV